MGICTLDFHVLGRGLVGIVADWFTLVCVTCGFVVVWRRLGPLTVSAFLSRFGHSTIVGRGCWICTLRRDVPLSHSWWLCCALPCPRAFCWHCAVVSLVLMCCVAAMVRPFASRGFFCDRRCSRTEISHVGSEWRCCWFYTSSYKSSMFMMNTC